MLWLNDYTKILFLNISLALYYQFWTVVWIGNFEIFSKNWKLSKSHNVVKTIIYVWCVGEHLLVDFISNIFQKFWWLCSWKNLEYGSEFWCFEQEIVIWEFFNFLWYEPIHSHQRFDYPESSEVRLPRVSRFQQFRASR